LLNGIWNILRKINSCKSNSNKISSKKEMRCIVNSQMNNREGIVIIVEVVGGKLIASSVGEIC